MIVGRRIAARTLGLLLAALGARTAGAQSIALSVAPLSPLLTDSLTPAPTIAVSAVGAPEQFAPFSIQVDIAHEPQFRAPFFSPSLMRCACGLK